MKKHLMAPLRKAEIHNVQEIQTEDSIKLSEKLRDGIIENLIPHIENRENKYKFKEAIIFDPVFISPHSKPSDSKTLSGPNFVASMQFCSNVIDSIGRANDIYANQSNMSKEEFESILDSERIILDSSISNISSVIDSRYKIFFNSLYYSLKSHLSSFMLYKYNIHIVSEDDAIDVTRYNVTSRYYSHLPNISRLELYKTDSIARNIAVEQIRNEFLTSVMGNTVEKIYQLLVVMVCSNVYTDNVILDMMESNEDVCDSIYKECIEYLYQLIERCYLPIMVEMESLGEYVSTMSASIISTQELNNIYPRKNKKLEY